eukprot:ANDGO_02232.mRNA.1 von willebrand factor type A (VWA) domain was originally protein
MMDPLLRLKTSVSSFPQTLSDENGATRVIHIGVSSPRMDSESPRVSSANSHYGISVIAVVDVSGSMKGEAIVTVIRALQDTVDLLRPFDIFGIVIFAQESYVLFPPAYMNTHNKELAKYALSYMDAGGGTSIREGLLRGLDVIVDSAHLARKMSLDNTGSIYDRKTLFHVWLLTDGQAAEDPAEIADYEARFMQQHDLESCVVHGIGLGTDHDASFLKQVVFGPSGRYVYMKSHTDVHDLLQSMTEMAQSVVFEQVLLRIRGMSSAFQLSTLETMFPVKTISAAVQGNPDVFQINLGQLCAGEERSILAFVQDDRFGACEIAVEAVDACSKQQKFIALDTAELIGSHEEVKSAVEAHVEHIMTRELQSIEETFVKGRMVPDDQRMSKCISDSLSKISNTLCAAKSFVATDGNGDLESSVRLADVSKQLFFLEDKLHSALNVIAADPQSPSAATSRAPAPLNSKDVSPSLDSCSNGASTRSGKVADALSTVVHLGYAYERQQRTSRCSDFSALLKSEITSARQNLRRISVTKQLAERAVAIASIPDDIMKGVFGLGEQLHRVVESHINSVDVVLAACAYAASNVGPLTRTIPGECGCSWMEFMYSPLCSDFIAALGCAATKTDQVWLSLLGLFSQGLEEDCLVVSEALCKKGVYGILKDVIHQQFSHRGSLCTSLQFITNTLELMSEQNLPRNTIINELSIKPISLKTLEIYYAGDNDIIKSCEKLRSLLLF